MNHAKINLFFERFWLIVGILGLIYGFYMVSQVGLDQAKMFLLYPLIAFALFGVRHRLRKRMTDRS